MPKPFEPENRGTLIGHASSTRAYEFMTPAKLIELALVELSGAFKDATVTKYRNFFLEVSRAWRSRVYVHNLWNMTFRYLAG